MAESLGDAVLSLRTDNAPLAAGLASAYQQVKTNGLKSKAAWAGAMTLAAGATAVAAFKIGESFDNAYDKIRVGTGKTGKVLEKLKNDFREVVRGVPTDFDSAATAVTELHKRLDLTGRPLQKLSKQLLELSRITDTDIATNTREVTRLFGDWSIATKDQSKTLDGFFRLSQKTGIEVGELASTLVQFGSPLRTLGLDFDFAAAMVARFEKEGVNMTTLMSGLRLAVANLSDPTDELKDRFKEMGITAKEPAEAVMQVMEAIEKTGSVTKGNTLAFEVFGRRAGADMAAAIREGRFELDQYLKAMQGGGDTIRKAGRDTMDFSEHLQKFKNNVLVELEPVAVRVFEAVGSAMKDITKIISDPDLSGAQKFGKIVDLAANAIKDNVDKIAEAGVRLGAKLASSIIRGMLDAPVWVQWAAGGLLLAKLGGAKGFSKLGRLIGSKVGAGIVVGLALALPELVQQAYKLGQKIGHALDAAIPAVSEIITSGMTKQIPIKQMLRLGEIDVAIDTFKEMGLTTQQAKRRVFELYEEMGSNRPKRSADEIQGWGRTTRNTFQDTGDTVRKQTRGMDRDTESASRGVRRSAQRNFPAAAEAVTRSIHQMIEDSKRGNKAIERMMMQALRKYGVKDPAVVLQETERRANAPVARRAGGGVPIPGQGTGDKVPVSVGGVPVALTEPGERMFILNRNANSALDRLQALNKVVPRQAGGFVDLWGRGFAHLQEGGMVDPAGPGTGVVNPAIAGIVGAWSKKYDAAINYGYDPGGGHVSPGHNVTGTATDTGPAAGWGAGPTKLFEAGLRAILGKVDQILYGSHGIGTPWPNHGWGNHAHIEWGMDPNIAGFRGMGASIKLPRFEALTQFATSSAQALNNLSFGLEERLNRGLSSMGGGEGSEVGISAGGQFNKAELMALWRQVNGNLGDANLMAAIALAESGGDPNIVNSIGAGGLWQIHPPEPNYLDPVVNATIAGRKFQESGLSPWEAYTNGAYQQFMQKGGLVPGFKEGGIVGLIDRFVGDYKATEGAGDRRNLISETAKRIKDSKQLGVDSLTPEGDLAGTLQTLRDEADKLGEWASNAGSLSDTDAEGNEIPGVFQGQTEAEWIAGPGDLRGQLEALFELRNALTVAMEAIERTREKVRKMIERAKKQLEKVQAAIKTGKREQRQLEKKRRQLEKDLEDASNRKERDNKHIQARLEDELAKPPKKRDERRIAQLRERLHSRSSEKDAIRDDLARNSAQMAALAEKQAQREKLRDALKGPISEALTGRNSALTSGSDTVLSELSSVQGSGMDTGFLPELPGLGVLGGEIFDAQSALARLGAEQPEISDTETAEAPEGFSISELMDFVEAIRYGVFDQDLISQMPAMHGGGVVGGAPGTQEVIRKLELGEGVIDAGTMRDGLGRRRGEFTITNWREGTGYFEEIADGQITERDRSDRAAYTAGRAG